MELTSAEVAVGRFEFTGKKKKKNRDQTQFKFRCDEFIFTASRSTASL